MSDATMKTVKNPSGKTWLEKIEKIDRRWIFLLVGLGTLLPILFPIGFPVSVTPPVKSIYEKIETLGPGDVVLFSYDYGPTTAAENAPMIDAVLRHCLQRRIKVIALALYPLGGFTETTRSLSVVMAEYPDRVYGVDYVNLGYKDGAQAAMRQMAEDMHAVFPTDSRGTALAEIPLMQQVRSLKDVDLVVTVATGIIGEWWANLINAQFGIPIALGCTAVSAPKYYAYLDAGQIIGLMGGLKGASEYERLLIDGYPLAATIYDDPLLQSAMKGMDVQTIDHVIIIGFIVLGNVAFFMSRRRAPRR